MAHPGSESTKAETELLPLPSISGLISDLFDLAKKDDAVARCVAAAQQGFFEHPDGRRDPLEDVVLELGQLALLSHLCRRLPSGLSVDVGFGMGSSAAAILGTRRANQDEYRHIAIDPFGLENGRGNIVLSYLQAEFNESFQRIYKLSQAALPELHEQFGAEAAGLIFVDGNHTFEDVIVDFVWSDRLCAVGGYIVFDDFAYPAIETVVNYIEANRPNYRFARLRDINTAVLQKAQSYSLPWFGFKPFDVVQRENWTKA